MLFLLVRNMNEIEEIRREIDEARAILATHLPFVSSVLHRIRIILGSLSLPSKGVGITRAGVLIIDPSKWEKLSDFEKVFVLAHEVMHLVSFHFLRSEGKDFVIWNVVCDAGINYFLSQLMKVPDDVVQGAYLFPSGSGWQSWTVEEMYEFLVKEKKEDYSTLLKKTIPSEDLGTEGIGTEGIGSVETEGIGGGTGTGVERAEGTEKAERVVQEGDKELYEGSREEKRRKWEEVIARAYMAQKLVGKVPAGMERWIEGILRPKLPVHALLRMHLREGIGKTVVGTWVRQSRKDPNMPWIKRFTIPNLWALVDTSGSISSKDLELFIGVIYEFASLVSVRVICWDAQVYETIKCREKQEVLEKLKKAMKGGGGTVIAPALEKVLGEMKPWDLVVILSDGYIWDWNEGRTQELLRAVARKASKALLLLSGMGQKQCSGWITLRFEED